MKSIKVKNCRTCPYILYDDGKGFTSAFWRCGGFNIMLIDQETGIHNNLDEIHAQCKLDEYADTDGLVSRVNDILDKHIEEAGCWDKHEGLVGNTDKESWWKGAKAQAVKFKAILNDELTATRVSGGT